jgi:NADH:ubiquinone oxidoreductase subunit 6 (subunit J)
VAILVLALILNAVRAQPFATAKPPMTIDLTKSVGETVLTRFVLQFELLAVLMLVALLSAIYFARPEE